MYIFGYGSLLNINSAQKSFKRQLKHEDFIPVVVRGYEKVWNAIEYITFEGEQNSTNGIFLNLNKNEKVQTNGVLLQISEEEFEYLKLREKNYACIQIQKEHIQGFEATQDIFTFMTTNENKIATKGQAHCVIPKKYIGLLEEGLKPYDKSFQEAFIRSYNNYPFDIKEGTYKFSDPIQNKFAKGGFHNES